MLLSQVKNLYVYFVFQDLAGLSQGSFPGFKLSYFSVSVKRPVSGRDKGI